jgi:hypothetical protein
MAYGNTFNTIKLRKGASEYQDEYIASTVITPGNIVELIAGLSSGVQRVQKAATAAGKTSFMFALEDELQGKGIDDNYAIGDRVQVWTAGRGDWVNACLQDEETINVGDYLEIAVQLGTLRKWVSGTPVAVALQALDLSSFPEGSESSAKGAYNNPRIKVQIL